MGARAFDPNRDIKIEASETAAGVYALRTRGLSDQKRPELEIAGVPEAALNAAGGVINMIAEYTVNKAEVLAGQNVGNVIAAGEDGAKLLLVVRALAAEPPAKGGLWAKLSGGGSKGVLRLLDADGPDGAPPLTALATMLVHRAAIRLAKGDDEGARTELDAALATFPGAEGGGAEPSFGGADGAYNFQNHLAYLELAKLAGDDVAEAGARFAEALARSDAFARRELGATAASARSFDAKDVAAEATRILEHNLGNVERVPGPTPAHAIVASPIWELDREGRSARQASLMPAALVELYYGGMTGERLLREGAAVTAKILSAEDAERRFRAAWIARPVRGIWLSDDAPLGAAITSGPAHPAHGLVSTVLADVARCFRAGATSDEVLGRYDGAPSDALTEKLLTLEAWEVEQFGTAMTM